MSKRYHKILGFAEFGYRSIVSWAENECELGHHRKALKAANFIVQGNVYQAFLKPSGMNRGIWEVLYRSGILVCQRIMFRIIHITAHKERQ